MQAQRPYPLQLLDLSHTDQTVSSHTAKTHPSALNGEQVLVDVVDILCLPLKA